TCDLERRWIDNVEQIDKFLKNDIVNFNLCLRSLFVLPSESGRKHRRVDGKKFFRDMKLPISNLQYDTALAIGRLREIESHFLPDSADFLSLDSALDCEFVGC
ncbi:hypothetical protein PENTCL1PPCAC_19709, partial [Pristionchus entomophagus]